MTASSNIFVRLEKKRETNCALFQPPEPLYPYHNMTISGISLPKETRKGDKNLSQKFIFQLGTLNPHGRGLMNASNGTNLVMVSYHHFFTDDVTNPL